MRKTNKNSGFTIIEVVIVLALAAFIFTIVFFAVPQLQRSLRDNQRGSDAARVLTELLNYSSQNEGDFPDDTELPGFVSTYLDGLTLSDPTTGVAYVYEHSDTAGANAPTAVGEVTVYRNSQCNGETTEILTGLRNVAVVMMRDNGNNTICRDNS